MTRPHRDRRRSAAGTVTAIVLLVSLAAIVLPRTSRAGGARPQYSTVPTVIRLAGHFGGSPDPSAAFRVVARDLGGNPVAGVQVDLDFTACPDVRLCAEQPPGVVVSCEGRRVTTFANTAGEASFVVLGAATNRGGDPGGGMNTLRVYADGMYFGAATVNVWDQNGGAAGGTPGVDVTDLAAWLRDFGTGGYFGRSDYDVDGMLGVNDFQRLVVAFGAGASSQGCGSLCP